MGSDATLFRIPAVTFEKLRTERSFKSVAQSLWAADAERGRTCSAIAKSRVHLGRVWNDLPLVFEAIDGLSRGSTAHQLCRLKPIRGLRGFFGYTVTPNEVMVLAATWAQAAQRLTVPFRAWTGPPTRMDLVRGKRFYSQYEVIAPDEAVRVMAGLGERIAGQALACEYPVPWVLDEAASFVQTVSEGAIRDEGMMVLASA